MTSADAIRAMNGMSAVDLVFTAEFIFAGAALVSLGVLTKILIDIWRELRTNPTQE